MLKSLVGACLFSGVISSFSPMVAEPVSSDDWNNNYVSQNALDLVVDPTLGNQVDLNGEDDLAGGESVNLDTWLAQDNESSSSSANVPRESYGYVSLGLGVGLPNNANADDVSIRLGNRSTRGSVEQSLDLGFSGEVAGGYQYKDVRFELAVGYGSIGGSGGTISTTVSGRPVSFNYDNDISADYVSVLVNGYYDIPTGTKWRPYLGAGLGYVHVSAGDIVFNTDFGQLEVVTQNSAGTFGYQGKLGLSYEATPKGNVFGEVAYLGTPSYKSYSGLGVWRFALGWRQGF
jgi:opacity protein-like surface antigen